MLNLPHLLWLCPMSIEVQIPSNLTEITTWVRKDCSALGRIETSQVGLINIIGVFI
jgi:hypothetical protein